MRTTFFYLRNSANCPVVCFALQHDRGSDTLSYQVSTWNPVDVYNKHLARKVAEAKLNAKPFTVKVSKDANPHELHLVMVQDLLTNHKKTSSCPRRTELMATEWVKNAMKACSSPVVECKMSA